MLHFFTFYFILYTLHILRLHRPSPGLSLRPCWCCRSSPFKVNIFTFTFYQTCVKKIFSTFSFYNTFVKTTIITFTFFNMADPLFLFKAFADISLNAGPPSCWRTRTREAEPLCTLLPPMATTRCVSSSLARSSEHDCPPQNCYWWQSWVWLWWWRSLDF